jgi:hypothetical protein
MFHSYGVASQGQPCELKKKQELVHKTFVHFDQQGSSVVSNRMKTSVILMEIFHIG